MSQSPNSAVSTKFWPPGGVPAPTLFERYEILGIIGQGGMGTVYKGFHLNLKRYVAIKTLRIDQDQSPELVQRFRREMELVGQMDHPHVVRASDAGEKNGVFYLVMELLSGADLGKLVARRGPLAAADACEAIRQAALGLDYLHRSFVHRDIKPSNLMLTTGGIVKILDLGLARGGPGGQEHTPRGCAVGTFSYMAPEQANTDAAVDGRADIYSLGCTFFKLLTGRSPYSGPEYDSPAKQIFAHCQIPLSAVQEFQTIPEPLREILARMTAKNPEERYQNGAEVAQALTPHTAGCQLLALLGLAAETAEPEVRPLTGPLPADLSRLTELPVETPHHTRAVPETAKKDAHAAPSRYAVYGGIGLLLVGLAALTLVITQPWSERPGELPHLKENPQPKKEPVRMAATVALDELPLQTYHSLLDAQPLPVGHETKDDWKWLWDKGAQRLELKGPDTLLFPLGSVTRSRFSFEASITQAPWTGNTGIFWGYHEDETRRKAKKPLEDFAWFQLLSLRRETGAKGEARFSVARGKGSLRYNQLGEIAAATRLLEFHDIALPTRESVLQIEVFGNRVHDARFGGVELSGLCSDQTNQMFQKEAWQGKIGVFSLSHACVFRNVRFIALSKN